MKRTSLEAMVAITALLASACGTSDGDESGTGGSTGAGGRTAGDGGSTGSGGETETATDPGVVGTGEVTGVIRVNHIGYRSIDVKVGVLLDLANATVELRSGLDDSLVETFTSGSLATDDDSGDTYSTVDFSEVTTPGSYYLHLPATGDSSYAFRIADDAYDIVGAVAMKSFYFQRANHAKELPYASDALAGWAGAGREWVDGESHPTDYAAPAGPGSADHGELDVHGGWFDAGDYQKTLWGRGVAQMLWGYELNPSVWTDGQLNIPESGNGVPDLLDELSWELDFYVRMQRPDGHFMSSAKGQSGDVTSPPSASDETRVYFDGTSPSGDGWSGGGVTIERATGQAVLALAHAAIVYDTAGVDDAATRYHDAALSGWDWLADATTSDEGEQHVRAAAAAAIYRLDASISTAQAVVEGFAWDTWDGGLPYSVTPSDETISQAAWHCLANEAASSTLQSRVEQGVVDAIVERAFGEQGVYGGMYGGIGNGWDWSWGSNRANSLYGANLMMAAHFGATGSRSAAEVEEQAQRHLHYMLGRNPLNMVYLTNMDAYGGEHSSFQIYHSWFSYSTELGEFGNADYNGKPESVTEPLYPYHPDDDQTSTFGPAPGLVPGGPNYYYGGTYDIPNAEAPAYAYRDFSVGCDWDGDAGVCRAASWEITEPMCAYQGPFVQLVSFFMTR